MKKNIVLAGLLGFSLPLLVAGFILWAFSLPRFHSNQPVIKPIQVSQFPQPGPPPNPF